MACESGNLSFWNDFELKKPPLVNIQVKNTKFAKHIFVAINRYLQQLTTPDATEFSETAAMIGRLMARRKNSFHNMPGFRDLCKLNAALCRLLRLDLPRELEHFRSALPDICDNELAGDLPTRSSFEYILVRLLAYYHLQERIRDCCLGAANYFAQMLRNNFFMEFLTLLMAAVAKINKLSSLQSNKCVTLYNKLRPQVSNFPLVENHKFLPKMYELPAQLSVIKAKLKQDDPASATPSSTVLLKPPPLITKVEKAKQEIKSDVGTVIERKSEVHARKPKNQTEFDVDTLATIEDVKRFIARESKARNQSPVPAICVTKSIPKNEWLTARTLFQNKLQAKENKKALTIFRKFISSKIKT
ncbi:uncharacterized protein [Drosophila tropicalis]|uniref:uncharacterized protein n=1 Tax=Drosophila tropicalis TaxID=46794 RepID=UPI0035AB9C15